MSEDSEATKYRNPTPTVDIIIELEGDRVVLIRRRNPPLGWALPGGFVDEGECVERAAVREAKEETGLEVELRELLYVYSAPSRDPRQHTLSTVFIARADGAPHADDDALEARAFDLDALPEAGQMCFDHEEILNDYKDFKKYNRRPSPGKKLARHGGDS